MAVIAILGTPIEKGSGRPGCGTGPLAYRGAELARRLTGPGHRVADHACILGLRPVGHDKGPLMRKAGVMTHDKRLLDENGVVRPLVASLDMAGPDPSLDDCGKTARLMVDPCASLMGSRVMDRPTPRF